MPLSPNAAGLLARIEAESAWDILPILADALEESGYADGPALLAMRNGDETLHHLWLRRVVEGEETFTDVKESVNWLTSHAARFADWDYVGIGAPDADGDYEDHRKVMHESPGLDWLLDACKRFRETNRMDCLSHDLPEETWDEADLLWLHYQTLTGTPALEEVTEKYPHGQEYTYTPQPFRCAC